MKRAARKQKTETIDVTDLSSWRESVLGRTRLAYPSIDVAMVGGPGDGAPHSVSIRNGSLVLPLVVHVPYIKTRLPTFHEATKPIKPIKLPMWEVAQYRLRQRKPKDGGGVEFFFQYIKPKAKRKKVAR